MIELELNAKGEFCKKLGGAGRKWPINEENLLSEICKEKDCTYSQAKEELATLKEKAILLLNRKDEFLESQDISVQSIEIMDKYNPFQDFQLILNQSDNSQGIYYQKDDKTEFVCSYSEFDSGELKRILEKYDEELLDNLHKGLALILSPKNWLKASIHQTLDLCFSSRLLSKTIKRRVVTTDPHPACIQGVDKFSLTVIPFTQKEVRFCDLNLHLQDFLKRVNHHEYLCAILWSNFIGHLLPYVIYLRGDGGDGKTSFINMLGKLAKSYANFDGGDRFNYFNMFGKSIIGLNENESSKLMQNRVVKSISGGNLVQIEGKGKNSFSGQIRGLIFIDSNNDLELLGREDEKRRLRYFRVASITKTTDHVTIAQDTFVGLMGSTPNEFLNYCRVCYENLNIPGSGGLVKELPNQDETFNELIDVLQSHKFDEFFKQQIQGSYALEGKCESINILIALEKKFPKDPYIQRNFKKYLEGKHGIKTSGKYFIGLSKYDKQLMEAMPK